MSDVAHRSFERPLAVGATRRLAHWIASTGTDDLPPEVRHHARRSLVDYLGAAVAGSTAPLSQRLRRHMEATEPGDQATTILGGQLTASAAAFVNGTAAHGLELDDGYTPGAVHPSATTLPAALAMAESTGARPDRLLTAIAIGLETTCRIAAAGHPATLHGGFHNTAVAGVFGATAAAVKLLGGDVEATASALGLAGSHAGGLHEYQQDGSEIKRLHAGKSARDGLSCARLASAGMPGPHTVLEGRQGYFAAFTRDQWRPDVLLDALGEDWVSLRTYIKPYPCCRHLHGPIDAALDIRARGLRDTRQIVRLDVSTFEIASRLDRSRPDSFIQAQFSIPHAVAAALRFGNCDISTFEESARTDEEVNRLARLVSVATDPELNARYPEQRPAVVTATLQDGTRLSSRVDQPLGEPANPIDDARLDAKFLRLTVPVLGREHATRTLKSAWTLDGVAAVTTKLGREHVTGKA